jgi:cytochrome c oxidase cbb3-type subunit 3
MPRWWVWTFYATIVWALGYTILYPAWPLVNEATKGVLGYSSRAELAGDLEGAKIAQGEVVDRSRRSRLRKS